MHQWSAGLLAAAWIISQPAVAEGITMDDVFAHVISTHPGFRTFDYAPKIAAAERDQSMGAYDWRLDARSNFHRNHDFSSDDWRSNDTQHDTQYDLTTTSLATGIRFGLGQYYSRYWTNHTSPYDHGNYDYSHVLTWARASVPLWNNAFGAADRTFARRQRSA